MNEEEKEKQWAEGIAKAGQAFEGDHIKKEYTLSIAERSEMIKVTGITAFADQITKIAEQLGQNILNLNVLPRIGVTPSIDKKVYCDPECGKIAIWVPKTTLPE